MIEENYLPSGWVWSSIEELATSIQYGYTESAKDQPVGPKFLRITDIQDGGVDWNSVPFCICPEEEHNKYLLRSGDIVFARTGATTGKSYLITDCPDAVFASYLIRLRFENLINFQYIFMFLNSPLYWSQIMTVRKGSAQPGVNATSLATLKVPIAPVKEQHRIVATIEQQFTRLDAGIAALRRAQTKHKRYRAAVLKAAVEGELTATWRTQHPGTEPASILLERIHQERRAKWEADLKGQGKDPSKARYIEPAKPNTENLPELPQGWCWATVEQFGDVGTGATPLRSRKEYYEGGIIPWVTSSALNANVVTNAEEFITEKALAETNAKVFPVGTLLLAMYGEGKTRGKVSELKISAATNQACAAIIFLAASKLCQPYVKYFLLSNYFEIRRLSAGGVQPNLNLSIVKETAIPLPPLTEQEQIISEVERRLSVVTELEATIEANLRRAERLRQSILKEAFAGRLVPQDPNDEPASILLERIRKERNEHKNGANNKSRIVSETQPMKIDVALTEQAELWGVP